MSQIAIKALDDQHISAFQELASDPAISATSNVPDPYPEDGAAQFVANAKRWRDEGFAYAFGVHHGDDIVGCTGIHELTDDEGSLGFWIGKPYWGRGFATEAGLQTLKYAFFGLKLKQLNAWSLLTNRASTQVLEKLGFHLTAVDTIPGSKWPDQKIAKFVLRREMFETGQGI